MNPWFRFYHEALDDPKVQQLEPELFRDWVNLLCLACRHDGILPPLQSVSFALRKSPEFCMKIIEDLKGFGLIDLTKSGKLRPHNWESRQFKSDNAYERVKRFRKRNRNVNETANETHQIQIQNRKNPPTPLNGARPADPAYAIFAEAFMATHRGTPYMHKKADFIQLAALRKALGMTNGDAPPDWNQAIANYLATPREPHTFADLCVNYATFRLHPLDRFGKPVEQKPKLGQMPAKPTPVC